MIGLDTNILVRYFTQDDDAQIEVVNDYIEELCTHHNSIFINTIVLCELIWVLETAYKYKKSQIANVIEQILHTSQFSFQNPEIIMQALMEYKRTAADFSDALIGISNKFAGSTKTLTFDKKASKLTGFELLK